MRILIVEDDQLDAQALYHLLTNHSYAIDIARRGRQCLDLLAAFDYDLVILDLRLPDQDGISLCQSLRAQGYAMPVMLLTGTDQAEQKAAALNAGADDYVVKPFDNQELIARVLALLRRCSATIAPLLTWGALQLDPSSRSVVYDRCELTLTPKEYAVLELLLRHGEQVFSARAIVDQVWSAEELPMEETVRTHIKGLRQKLKAAGAPANLIETVYRVGYRLNPLMRDTARAAPNGESATSPETSPDSQATPNSEGRMAYAPTDWPGGNRAGETQIWDKTSMSGGGGGTHPRPLCAGGHR